MTASASSAHARRGADYFPNVTLTTQDGEPVRFYDDLIKGKIVAINLIYTTCKYACPLETARMSQVQKLLGDRMGSDVFFYSITIDPEHDTPAVLKEYAREVPRRPGLDVPHRQEGRHRSDQQEARALFAARSGEPRRPHAVPAGRQRGDRPVDAELRRRQPGFLARTIGDWLNSWQTKSTEPLEVVRRSADELTLDRGQYTFTNHCAACHTIGGGDHFGPDLQGVTARRDRDWLARFIVSPEKVREAGDPVALALRAKYKSVVMPSLDLGSDDAKVLIEYIERESGASGETAGLGRGDERSAGAGTAPATLTNVKPISIRICGSRRR